MKWTPLKVAFGWSSISAQPINKYTTSFVLKTDLSSGTIQIWRTVLLNVAPFHLCNIFKSGLFITLCFTRFTSYCRLWWLQINIGIPNFHFTLELRLWRACFNSLFHPHTAAADFVCIQIQEKYRKIVDLSMGTYASVCNQAATCIICT